MNLKQIRKNLLLGSAFVISGVVGGGYGRGAYAACLASPSPTYICSGNNNVTQSILNVTDATVSTVPGFDVNAAAGNGVEITGDGDISFTDANESDIDRSHQRPLYPRRWVVLTAAASRLTSRAM